MVHIDRQKSSLFDDVFMHDLDKIVDSAFNAKF